MQSDIIFANFGGNSKEKDKYFEIALNKSVYFDATILDVLDQYNIIPILNR